MKRNFTIVSEGDECYGTSMYGIQYGNKKHSEFDEFLAKFDNGDPNFKRDIGRIQYWLEKSCEEGMDWEEETRDEGGYRRAIPLETSKLRLYIYIVSDCTLIIGNGGIKNKRAFQQIPELHRHAQNIMDIGRTVVQQIDGLGNTQLVNCEIVGNRNFYFYERELVDNEREEE